jgi:hypothetical protein
MPMNFAESESSVDNFDSSLNLFTELTEEELERYKGGSYTVIPVTTADLETSTKVTLKNLIIAN